jgi:hypothetical protein
MPRCNLSEIYEICERNGIEAGRQIQIIFNRKSHVVSSRRQGQRSDIPKNSSECSQRGETREEVAKLAGVSHDTIRKVKVIQQQAADPVKKKGQLGGLSPRA